MSQNTNLTNLTNLFFHLELENLRIGFLSDDNQHIDCFVLEQRLVLFESILKAQSSESKANSFVLCRVVKSFEELKVHFQKCFKRTTTYHLEETTALNSCNPCNSWLKRRKDLSMMTLVTTRQSSNEFGSVLAAPRVL